MRTPEAGGGSWASTLRYREEVVEDGEGKGKRGRWYLCTGVFQRYRPQMDVSPPPSRMGFHSTRAFESMELS